MKYGKLIEGVLQVAEYLIIGNEQIFNASDTDFLAQGYWPIKYTSKPTDGEYQPVYTEVDGTILQSWVYEGKIHDHSNYNILENIHSIPVDGIQIVRVLPSEANEGDIVLYSPAPNTFSKDDASKEMCFDYSWIKDYSGADTQLGINIETESGVGFFTFSVAYGMVNYNIMIDDFVYMANWNQNAEGEYIYDSASSGAGTNEKWEQPLLEPLASIKLPEKIVSVDVTSADESLTWFYINPEFYVYRNGKWEKEARSKDGIPTKTSQLENDSGFITKADIPTDESYELLGETPLTIENKSNIKLVADGETNYSIETPTVWNFDDFFKNNKCELVKCTLDTSEGHYMAKPDKSVTAWHQSYIKILIPVVVGETYKIWWDASSSQNNLPGNDWGGNLTLYSGTDTSNIITTGLGLDKTSNKGYQFTAQHDVLQLRYYMTHGSAGSLTDCVARFNSLYLNYADASDELTEIYKQSGSFNDVITFSAVPANATITTDTGAQVYTKNPTDKTLTESDIPADAKVTGEKIAEVKSYLPLYGKTIVNFGDSIFGNTQPPVDISTFLAEKTGATVYNCGFGGCRMSVHPTAWYNAFCMYNLADAITTRDFTLQNEAVASGNLAERYGVGLERLKSIDFSTVDIITIAYGTNDYAGVQLDNAENPYDTATLAGALRYSIEKLLTAYPNLRIFVLSTTYRFWTDENNEYTEDSNTKLNSINLKLTDYNAKLKEVAAEYNLPYVDDYNIGIGKFNRYQYFSTTDGTHHKESGRKLIAEHLAKEMY